MKVKTVMVRDVVTCTPDAAMSSVAWEMWRNDCGFLPVVDGATHELLGVITDRDICMAGMFEGRSLSEIPVRASMITDLVVCEPGDSLRDVHGLMRDYQVRRVPVVDGEGRLLGVVTLNDLAVEAWSGRGPAATKRQRDVGKTLAAVCEHRELPAPEPESGTESDGAEAAAE